MYCHIKDIDDKDRPRAGIDKVVTVTHKSQIKLSTSVLTTYVMNNTLLEKVTEIKDWHRKP